MVAYRKSRESKKYNLILLLTILVAAFILYAHTAALPQPSNDDIFYMGTAYYTSLGQPLEYNAFPFSVSYGIVLPLALFYRLMGFNLLIGVYYNIALSLIAIALIYKIGQQYSRYGGIFAALIFAFMPAVIGEANTITPDMFVLVMVLLSVISLQASIRRNGSRAYYVMAGFFAFASTFGNAVGYLFLFILFVYAAFSSLKKRSARFFNYALLGIVVGFALSMPINWYMSNGLTLSTGVVRYPYLFSTYYLYSYYMHTSGSPPSPFNISPISLIYGLFLLPTRYFSSAVTTQFTWPYAYGALIYLLLFSVAYSLKRNLMKKYLRLLIFAFSIFAMQLIIMVAVISNQGFFQYFRFELLIIAPLAIFTGVVLSEYVTFKGSNRKVKRNRKYTGRVVITMLILCATIATGIYFGYVYSVKNAHTTNMFYGNIGNLSIELSRIVGQNSTIYTPYILPPFTTGRIDIMFYSSAHGINPGRFALLNMGSCTSLRSGSYIIIAGNSSIMTNFSKTCNARLLYNTSESVIMPYIYGIFKPG